MTALTSARARAVVNYLGSHDYPFARLGRIEAAPDYDFIDLLVEPELPQDRAVAIIDIEPVRLAFPVDDATSPLVYSLREDFPLNQVHTNYAPDSNGLCLCIWEENWADLRRGLTAQTLVERIRSWFSRTATSTLHDDGQALEPLLRGTAHSLIMPPGPPVEHLAVVHAAKYNRQWTVVLGEATSERKDLSFEMSVLEISFPPQVQGGLRDAPHSLEDLSQTAIELGADNVIDAVTAWLLLPAQLQRADKRHMLLILTIPTVSYTHLTLPTNREV